MKKCLNNWANHENLDLSRVVFFGGRGAKIRLIRRNKKKLLKIIPYFPSAPWKCSLGPRLWLAHSYRKCLLLAGKFIDRNDDPASNLYLRQSNMATYLQCRYMTMNLDSSYIYIYFYVQIFIHIYKYIHIYIYICVCVCVCVSMCVCVSVRLCV